LTKLGPICRTTVLRPTPPRATPNAPAAAQQGQAPNAGGIFQWPKERFVIDDFIVF
jgi:hypothetical protein